MAVTEHGLGQGWEQPVLVETSNSKRPSKGLSGGKGSLGGRDSLGKGFAYRKA